MATKGTNQQTNKCITNKHSTTVRYPQSFQERERERHPRDINKTKIKKDFFGMRETWAHPI